MKNNNKGFIQIIAIIVILAISSFLAYQYNSRIKVLNDYINKLDNKITNIEEENIKLGGSQTGIQYGGLATSTVGWGGLVRYAGGYMATTSLNDADVPDNITLTNVPSELSFSSSTIGKLTAGTSTFTGTTTFTLAPIINATATIGTQAINKNFLNDFFKPTASVQASSSRALSQYYQNTHLSYMIVFANFRMSLTAGNENTLNGYVSTIADATSSMEMMNQCYNIADSAAERDTCSMMLFVPPSYYYRFATTSGGVTILPLAWTETY